MAKHHLSAVLVAVEDTDRETVNKFQRRQTTIADVVPVELDALLVAVELNRRFVKHVLLIARNTKVHVRQKLVVGHNRPVVDVALETVWC